MKVNLDLLQSILRAEQTLTETQIQHVCVAWFRTTFPNFARLLIAIPNGGKRSPASGAMRKYEGALAGASDLILFHKKNGYGALCIEMKKPKRKGVSAGTQSADQHHFQAAVEDAGYKYIICHGIQEFIEGVCDYANMDNTKYLEDVSVHFEAYLKMKL